MREEGGAERTEPSVLIVDNDAGIVELLEWFLRRRGWRVRTAACFADARTEILREPPALMLSDIDLGAESGREELPRLADEGLLPPTLIVSGYADGGLIAELSRLAQVRDALAKPFEFAELEARMRALLPGGLGWRPAPGAAAAASAGAAQVPDDEGWIEIRPSGP